jgi:hypothetical protein
MSFQPLQNEDPTLKPVSTDDEREPAPNQHWCKGCSPDNCPGCRNPEPVAAWPFPSAGFGESTV